MTRLAVPMLVVMLTAVAWAADVVTLEDWKSQKLGAKGIPDSWLGGQTWGLPQHDMTIEENDGQRVLHLTSKIESSTIRKDIKGKVNLTETPILEWTWKAVVLPTNADCRKKALDDQAAQLYVVWPRFPEAVRSQIIGYIWDTTAPAGTIVKSEKTGTVTYVVVRSGAADLGKWLTERRNVAEDYRKIYGAAPDNPGMISLAIDSDDTSSAAESFFGSILFRKP
jgi:Protein of unknown function (DUF3047)